MRLEILNPESVNASICESIEKKIWLMRRIRESPAIPADGVGLRDGGDGRGPGAGPAVEGSPPVAIAEARLTPFGECDDRVQPVVEKKLTDAIARGEDAHAVPADQFSMSHTHTDQLAAVEEEATAGSAVLGGSGGDEEESFIPALIELEPSGFDQPAAPARELDPQVDPDRGHERIGSRLRVAGGQPGHVR